MWILIRSILQRYVKCVWRERVRQTVSHIVSECKRMAQNEFKKRSYDEMTAIFDLKLYGFECNSKSYDRVAKRRRNGWRIAKGKSYGISRCRCNKPNLVLLDKKKRKNCYLINNSCPFNMRIASKEMDEFDTYNDLKYEIVKIWKGLAKKVIRLPLIIRALGYCTKKLDKSCRYCKIHVLQQWYFKKYCIRTVIEKNKRLIYFLKCQVVSWK